MAPRVGFRKYSKRGLVTESQYQIELAEQRNKSTGLTPTVRKITFADITNKNPKPLNFDESCLPGSQESLDSLFTDETVLKGQELEESQKPFLGLEEPDKKASSKGIEDSLTVPPLSPGKYCLNGEWKSEGDLREKVQQRERFGVVNEEVQRRNLTTTKNTETPQIKIEQMQQVMITTKSKAPVVRKDHLEKITESRSCKEPIKESDPICDPLTYQFVPKREVTIGLKRKRVEISGASESSSNVVLKKTCNCDKDTSRDTAIMMLQSQLFELERKYDSRHKKTMKKVNKLERKIRSAKVVLHYD